MSILTRTEGYGPTARQDRRGVRENPMSRAAAFVIMAVFTLYFLIPIWWLFVASTKSRGEFSSSAGLWFAEWNLWDNLTFLFNYDGGVYLRWLGNAVIYAGVGAALGTTLAAMCGYALAKYSFRGRDVLFNVILGGVLVPVTALALPLFLIFSAADLTNTYWSVFLPSMVSPFGVYLARIYAAASVPAELLEAARIDGSGEVRTFFTVAARLMAPALVTIFLFQFVTIWNNFFLPLVMLSNDELYPVTLGLYAWNSQTNAVPELRTAVIVGSFVAIVPLILAFLGLQRFWRGGLAAGGVKA